VISTDAFSVVGIIDGSSVEAMVPMKASSVAGLIDVPDESSSGFSPANVMATGTSSRLSAIVDFTIGTSASGDDVSADEVVIDTSSGLPTADNGIDFRARSGS